MVAKLRSLRSQDADALLQFRAIEKTNARSKDNNHDYANDAYNGNMWSFVRYHMAERYPGSDLAGKQLPVSDSGPVCNQPRAADLEPGSASVRSPRLAWRFEGFRNYKDKSTVREAALRGMQNLQQYAKQGEELRSLPWRAFINKIFAQWHGDSIVDAVKASRLCTDSAVREYFHAWKGAQELVYALLQQQQTKMTWKELRDASRPGAWLADLVCTALCVEMDLIERNGQFIAVGNDFYKEFGCSAMQLPNHFSDNSIGNIMEYLAWFAFEEQRYEWIVAVCFRAAMCFRAAKMRALGPTPSQVLALRGPSRGLSTVARRGGSGGICRFL